MAYITFCCAAEYLVGFFGKMGIFSKKYISSKSCRIVGKMATRKNNTVRKRRRMDEPYAANYMRAKRAGTAPIEESSKAGSDDSDIKDDINVGRV